LQFTTSLSSHSSFPPPPSALRVPKGLEGVIVTDTKVTKIDGQAGRLVYRGYDIRDLIRRGLPFEAVAYLLWNGKLPSEQEVIVLKKRLVEKRKLPKTVTSFLEETAPKGVNPLSVLVAATSLLALHSKQQEEEDALQTGIALTSQFPIIVAYYQRLRSGKEPAKPKGNFGHVKNYLHMLTGSDDPKVEHIEALNSYFILLADHGLNASTFAARVATSTLTDVYSAIIAAIATLKGPLHGGAPSETWEMFNKIGKPERAERWLNEKLQRGERIMGFGHRIYRTEDPRSKILKEISSNIADPSIFSLASKVEEIARRLLREKHPERPLDTNVEFYSSVVLSSVGIPSEIFTPTFACSRVVGWTAHILEQLSENRLIRPTSNYVGEDGLKVPSDWKMSSI
jgi:citrate synthase